MRIKGLRSGKQKGCPKESNMFRYVHQITVLQLKPQRVFIELKNNGDSALSEVLTHPALLPEVRRLELLMVWPSLQFWETPTT